MYVRRLFAKLTNFIRHGHAEAEMNREASAPGAALGLKQLGVVAERSEVAVFVLRHHTRMIANQNGSVYSTRCSAAYAVYREDQWQRRSKHTELES